MFENPKITLDELSGITGIKRSTIAKYCPICRIEES